MNKKNNSKLINLFVAFIFIDILLLPNLWFLVMPISLPLVISVFIFKKSIIQKDKEFLVYIILSLLVLISVGLSFLQTPKYISDTNLWIENIKRGFQLLTSFAYYFIIRNTTLKSIINIKKILFAFILTYLTLGLISFINVGTYFNVLEILKVRNPFVNDWYTEQNDYLFRYSYIWIDPNNAAYAFQMVAFYMLLNVKLNTFEKMFVFIAVLISLVMSMSTGAIISAAIFLLLYTFLKLKSIHKYKGSYEKMLKNTIFALVGIILIGFGLYYLGDKFSYVKDYSINRVFNNTDGGRLGKYSFMVSDKVPNLIGEGYTLVRDGRIFRPHSDHLRFLYSYGIVAYFISLWFFFRKTIISSRYLFLIPGFMAFTVNSLIDEQKILIILLLLMALANYKPIEKEKHLK